MPPISAAWNVLQSRHRAAEGCQSAGALTFDQRFESFANQRRFLRDAGKLLGNADEVVIECKSGHS